MHVYFAAIHKDHDSDYTALFPGVPGCITAGADTVELTLMAREALQGHLEVCRDHGGPVPSPLPLEVAKIHEDAQGASFFLAVPVDIEEGPTVRLQITMPAGLRDRMDACARRRGLTRSGFLALAARREMEHEALPARFPRAESPSRCPPIAGTEETGYDAVVPLEGDRRPRC